MGRGAGEIGRAERLAVLAAAALVAGSALLAGVHMLQSDLVVTFRDEDPRVFSPAFLRQLSRAREIAPARARILLVAGADDAWRARLWQRALYPRNAVVVRYRPLPPGDELERLRRLSDFVLALGTGNPEIPLTSEERLGGEADVRIGTPRR